MQLSGAAGECMAVGEVKGRTGVWPYGQYYGICQEFDPTRIIRYKHQTIFPTQSISFGCIKYMYFVLKTL